MQINQRLPGAVTVCPTLCCCLVWCDFNVLCLTLSPHPSLTFPLLLQDDGCGFANHELSLCPWSTGRPPSQLHLLCSPRSSLVFSSSLVVSVLFPLSVFSSHHLLSPPVWWWISLHQFLLSEGLSGACDARGPRGRRPSQTFPTRCSLNSSWETNEDEFGAWMCFCAEGVLGFSQSVCSSVTPRLLKLLFVCFLFGLSFKSIRNRFIRFRNMWCWLRNIPRTGVKVQPPYFRRFDINQFFTSGSAWAKYLSKQTKPKETCFIHILENSTLFLLHLQTATCILHLTSKALTVYTTNMTVTNYQLKYKRVDLFNQASNVLSPNNSVLFFKEV